MNTENLEAAYADGRAAGLGAIERGAPKPDAAMLAVATRAAWAVDHFGGLWFRAYEARFVAGYLDAYAEPDAPISPDDPAIGALLLGRAGAERVRYEATTDEWHIHTARHGWHFAGYGSELADQIATREGL